jgi:hypothetical protein
LPTDHVAREVVAVLETFDDTELRESYSASGSPATDPLLMLRIVARPRLSWGAGDRRQPLLGLARSWGCGYRLAKVDSERPETLSMRRNCHLARVIHQRRPMKVPVARSQRAAGALWRALSAHCHRSTQARRFNR